MVSPHCSLGNSNYGIIDCLVLVWLLENAIPPRLPPKIAQKVHDIQHIPIYIIKSHITLFTLLVNHSEITSSLLFHTIS